MAVCRGGVSFWVGCIRSHGGRHLAHRHSWSVWQTVLNGNCRSLRSGSWDLASPNCLRYQSAQKTFFFHPLSNECRSLDEDWEVTFSTNVQLEPRDAEDWRAAVDAPLFGQVTLRELLALGDLSFPLTTVDGRREDDISVSDAKLSREQSSFRSLFETEGCPAPFTLGSRYFCFHCPAIEPVPEVGDKLRIANGAHTSLSRSLASLCSGVETENLQRGSSEKDMENEEKLALMYERLRIELPGFFMRNHDYSMYSIDVEFINGLLNMKTKGRVAYQLILILWRMMCLCYYADAKLEVLKLTKHPEDGSIKARWRVKGLPFHTLLFRFYKKDKSQFYRTFDAFSTFYLGSDGLVQCHKVEKVMQSQPPVLPKVTTLLAGALVAIGLQEDRPALNLLSLFLTSLRQAQD